MQVALKRRDHRDGTPLLRQPGNRIHRLAEGSRSLGLATRHFQNLTAPREPSLLPGLTGHERVQPHERRFVTAEGCLDVHRLHNERHERTALRYAGVQCGERGGRPAPGDKCARLFVAQLGIPALAQFAGSSEIVCSSLEKTRGHQRPAARGEST